MHSTSTQMPRNIFEDSLNQEYKTNIDAKLEALAEELNVPPTKYKEAKERYDAVGQWLNTDESLLATYKPIIYPQGSFALGTATKHFEKEDYDVDAVCVLQINEKTITQKELKNLVGERLKLNKTYAKLLDPPEGGRRCWTLQYADGSHFHLDILPAVPDDCHLIECMGVPKELAKHAICITDKDTWDVDTEWPKSNPQGYIEWFKQRMKAALEKSRRAIAIRDSVDIKDIPNYKLRTPLQKAIQLLKRHRDVNYNGDDDKPISIIITTLAALAYDNEDTLTDTILNIVPVMRQLIEFRNGEWWIANPVNPMENFADKWNETSRKKEIFFEWLEKVERDHTELFIDTDLQRSDDSLAKSYGKKAPSEEEQGALIPAISTTLLNVPHREIPPWLISKQGTVSINGHAIRKGFRTRHSSNRFNSLPKDFSLRFEANTNVQEPFDIYWQVVNTGEEASVYGSRGLRGKIFPGTSVQKESTQYTGTHWIECFIVKDGKCVARSNEFIVNIK